MNTKLDYKTLKDLFKELEMTSDELINCGNSNEKSRGYGMKEVLVSIYDYCKKNKIVLWK
jgi:hypothetical protein